MLVAWRAFSLSHEVETERCDHRPSPLAHARSVSMPACSIITWEVGPPGRSSQILRVKPRSWNFLPRYSHFSRQVIQQERAISFRSSQKRCRLLERAS